MPDLAFWRWRHDPEGAILSRSSDLKGGGYAVCLCCGRAESREPPEWGAAALHCREACRKGCATCILRPDLSWSDLRLDRPAGEALARRMLAQIGERGDEPLAISALSL